jgi:hypothetical protein
MSTEVAPRSRRWLWFFIALASVAAILLIWLALYIRNELDPARQLNLDQLRAARNLWKEKGPKDYEMVYEVRRGGESKPDTYFVKVRAGVAVTVTLNGQTLNPQQYDRTMVGLFNDIELFLKMDQQPNSPFTFCRGYFDTDDGHLLLFVRRVGEPKESVEIRVEEFRPTAAS